MFPGSDALAQGLYTMFKFIFSPDLAGGITDLQKTIATFNVAAYGLAGDINSTIIKPIAAVVLAIILVLELARISSRFDGDQKLAVQQVATAMIKAVLVIIAIQNVDLILGAINQVGDNAISAVAAPGSLSSSQSYPSVQEIQEADLPSQLFTGGLLIIPWLLALIAGIILKVIVFVRFAEIYVLSAAATLPLVFMAHPETKSIAVGYLKKYAAAVLQGLMIIIMVKVFVELKKAGLGGGGSSISGSDLLGTTLNAVPNMALSSVVFLFLIIASGRLARALVGE